MKAGLKAFVAAMSISFAATAAIAPAFGEFTKDGPFPEQALVALDQSFVDLGILPEQIDMKEVMDTRFLPRK